MIFSDFVKVRKFLKSQRRLHKRFLLWVGRKAFRLPMLARRTGLAVGDKVAFSTYSDGLKSLSWQAGEASLGEIDKIFVVFERFPNPQGHVGIGIVDAAGQERGIHFGSWESPEELAQVESLFAPRKGRVIVESDGFYRLREHGGLCLELNLSREQKAQWARYMDWILSGGKSLSGPGYLYGLILQNVELIVEPWKIYHIRDCNCVDFVLNSLIAAYDGDDRAGYLENLQASGEIESYSPYEFSELLGKVGAELGIVRQVDLIGSCKGRYALNIKQISKVLKG